MALLTLNVPDETLQAMGELAEITGIQEGKDRLAQLVQDAVRTYEWIIYQQINGKYVAVLEQTDVNLLTKSSEVHGEREIINPVFLGTMVPKVKEYFKKAA